ncbi:RHS domain-containing protein [Ornithobacterium rhinotracheale]|uniref:RHS domain-containing protein n=1 Tax=Ornithobacterium rhinotracheale TaxID=28251 RepID=UPI003FA4637F
MPNYHNNHLRKPNELTNQQGEVVWLVDYEAWGERGNSECLGDTLPSARRELCSSERLK